MRLARRNAVLELGGTVSAGVGNFEAGIAGIVSIEIGIVWT